jgi:hypothetical protein
MVLLLPRSPSRTRFAVRLTCLVALLSCACSGGTAGTSAGGTGSGSTASSTGLAVVVTAPATVTGGQAGYAASVTAQPGLTYAWTVDNGTIIVGDGTDSISFRPGASGRVTISCRVTNAAGVSATGSATATITEAPAARFYLDQALSDEAQSTTLAFAGFGMMTGGLGAQSFFPPGKVADYWGFQYLRDNDADGAGHNTSFLTRVACNVLYVLDDSQLASLKSLAIRQVDKINLYAWKRYPLMKAFRRLLDQAVPPGATGLNLEAIKTASADLYRLDGEISFERAVVYAAIYRTLSATQKSYLGAMVGKGFNAWPDKSESDVRDKTQGLSQDEVVAVMTYAGDMYSWFAGSLTSDVYFCPERHGTYFGSFYVKDAPAVGHPGYAIDETMTATVGRALTDAALGYVSPAGAALMNDLVPAQRQNLMGAGTSMVAARTKISEALRSLISSVEPSAAALNEIQASVDYYSRIYGELDGENNYHYATTFERLWNNAGGTYLGSAQKVALAALRKKVMTVTYPDGATVDYSSLNRFYLYAADLPQSSADLAFYTSDTSTDQFFRRF